MPLDMTQDVVLRCDGRDTGLAALLQDSGISAVLAENPSSAFAEACEKAGVRIESPAALTISDIAGYRNTPRDRAAAFGSGLWPGVSRGPNATSESEIASASRQPWVNANGFRIAWLKALCPERHPTLAYLPNADAGVTTERVLPFETLELALVEAWANGGNYVLALEPRYRAALAERQERALSAWRSLGKTARWLRENRTLFGRAVFPNITALVDAGEESAEIANLLFRHNASPALARAADPPAPRPDRLVIVAASIAAPPAETRRRILRHAEAGATVVVDTTESAGQWWRVPALRLLRDEEDRETFRLGKGRLVAYKSQIADPSDFALDVIDLATHARRAVRIWDATSAIAVATEAPPPHRAAVHVINYGRFGNRYVLAQVDGNFKRATLMRPEAEPAALETAARGKRTEFLLPQFARLAVVLLE